ncbi:MAG: tetratricopeptide repeat protein [Lachnospiraceae bacterium]
MEKKETVQMKKTTMNQLLKLAIDLKNRGEDEICFQLLQELADTEDPNAVNKLAYCYNEGIGTDPDEEKAFELAKQAEKLGAECAGGNVAFCYYEGKGVDVDYEKAFQHANKAIEVYEKDPNALRVLGLCYGYGHGVVQNVERGKQFLQEAIEFSNEGAQCRIAQKCYEELEAFLEETKTDAKPEPVAKKEQITETLRTLLGLLEDWEKE